MNNNGARPQCAVPWCERKQSDKNEVGMCFMHGDWLRFLLWAMPKIQVHRHQKPRLIIPRPDMLKDLHKEE